MSTATNPQSSQPPPIGAEKADAHFTHELSGTNLADRPTGRGDTPTVLGGLLIVLGIFFLVAQTNVLPLGRLSWPFFVILPGAALFILMAVGGRSTAGLAVPAGIVTSTGLILLYQNTFNHWESWAYAWALIFPTAVGFGLWLQGALSGQPGPRRKGQRFVEAGVTLFLGFAAFFEVVLNISGYGRNDVVRYGLPTALVVIGAYLLVRHTGERAWV